MMRAKTAAKEGKRERCDGNEPVRGREGGSGAIGGGGKLGYGSIAGKENRGG